jgi:hypothetical protein
LTISPALAQREIALAAVTLLAAIGSLALASHRDNAKPPGRLEPLTLDGGVWRVDLAGASPVQYGRRTNCSILLRPSTIGVTDSVLPCGVKLYLSYGNSPEVLTQVIERRAVPPGRKFELTPKLAEELGVDGVQQVRWAFAGTRTG